VIDHNKGGLIVDCGIRGFVPISQIVDFPRRPQNEQPRDAAQEIAEKLQPYVGRASASRSWRSTEGEPPDPVGEGGALRGAAREARRALQQPAGWPEGQGEIRSIAPFGVFVDLGGSMARPQERAVVEQGQQPEAGYKVGEEVEASHRHQPRARADQPFDPAPPAGSLHSTVADFKVGEIIDGTVTKLVNFGAFVRVRDGLEGLIHISELSHQRVAHPGDVVREGQTIKLKIISLDSSAIAWA